MTATTNPAQLRLERRTPACWRVTIDNPPINVMGPQMVVEFQRIIDAIEADEQVKVVVFESAVDGYFLNHSDFTGKLEEMTSLPAGPTGLPPWPDFLARLTRAPAGITVPRACSRCAGRAGSPSPLPRPWTMPRHAGCGTSHWNSRAWTPPSRRPDAPG